MSLQINLSEELEARVRDEAARQGIDPDDYASRLIADSLPTQAPTGHSLWQRLSPEEWIRETRAWSQSHVDWPVLPPGADDHAAFYDRGD